jgi:hypothetical protein
VYQQPKHSLNTKAWIMSSPPQLFPLVRAVAQAAAICSGPSDLRFWGIHLALAVSLSLPLNGLGCANRIPACGPGSRPAYTAYSAGGLSASPSVLRNDGLADVLVGRIARTRTTRRSCNGTLRSQLTCAISPWVKIHRPSEFSCPPRSVD